MVLVLLTYSNNDNKLTAYAKQQLEEALTCNKKKRINFVNKTSPKNLFDGSSSKLSETERQLVKNNILNKLFKKIQFVKITLKK